MAPPAAAGVVATGAGVAAATAGCATVGAGWATVGAGAVYVGAGAAAGVSLSLAQALTTGISAAKAIKDLRNIEFSFRAHGARLVRNVASQTAADPILVSTFGAQATIFCVGLLRCTRLAVSSVSVLNAAHRAALCFD